MNLDSYTRLNPYYDDEKEESRTGGSKSLAITCATLATMGVVAVLMWSKMS